MLCFVSLAAGSPFTLDLQPAAPPSHQAYRNTSLSSWGGSVVQDPKDGVYHLFATGLSQGCQMDAWRTNSMVIHASSVHPTGPFIFRDVALPVWHHNPQAMRHSDGTWLLYTTSADMPPERDCAGGPSAARRTGMFARLADEQLRESRSWSQWNESTDDRREAGGMLSMFGRRKPQQWVQCHHAKGPNGPWTFLNTSQSAAEPGVFAGTNPAPTTLPNGSVVVH